MHTRYTPKIFLKIFYSFYWMLITNYAASKCNEIIIKTNIEINCIEMLEKSDVYE